MGARPNILLVTTDQQKADTLSLYGNPVTRTPALERLAETGVVVDGHICNYPACSPARASLMTGRYPHATGVRALHIHLPEREITLPQVLRRAGYETALIGKNHVFADGRAVSQFRDGGLALRDWPTDLPELMRLEGRLREEGILADRRPDFDTWFGADHAGPEGPEFAALRDFSLQAWLWRSNGATGATPFPPEQCTTGALGARAVDFVDARADTERPWFLWLSFPEPHNPYHAPEPYASMYDPADVPLPAADSLAGKPARQHVASVMSGMPGATEDDLRRVVAMQLGMVSFVDDALATVLDALERSGARSRTIVVFTTDHGGYVGDHAAMHKSVAFYDALVRLPLVVSWPEGLPPGRLAEGFLEQVDVLPTLLDLAEVEQPPGVQGISAADALAGGPTPLRAAAFAECGEGRDPVTIHELPFIPDDLLDDRYFGWDGFVEGWLGKGLMVRTEQWKYNWYVNGDAELYDLRADPAELVNLAGRPESAGTERLGRDALLEFAALGDPLPLHTWHVQMSDVIDGTFPWPASTRGRPQREDASTSPRM